MKVVSIHQPAYLPWLGYFHKAMLSDVFVYLDTVQYEKNSFTNRNRILTKQGPIWLTVPVEIKGHTQKKIKDMGIALREAEHLGLSLPGLALAHQLYLSVSACGHDRDGTHALELALAAMSGIDWRAR